MFHCRFGFRPSPLLTAWLLAAASVAAAPPPQEPPLPAASTQRRFTVPLHDGHVQVDELLRALLAAYDLGTDALPLPSTRVDLTGTSGTLLLLGGRKLLLDTVHFRRNLDAQRLDITIDRERTQAVRRRLRARVAQFAARLAGEDARGRRYELSVPEPLDPARPLVVLVHGVESRADEFDDLQAFLNAPPHGCQTATFAWPNDESADRVAAALALRLRELRPQPIVLVGHSMGGLVCRAVVEDSQQDPGNVRTLVLIGTPNHGSDLAGLRFALEAQDVLLAANDTGSFARALPDAVLDHWRDGLGEAGGDLLPGSVFLTRLDSHGRNASVDYHLVLGTRALLRPDQLAIVQQAARQALAHGRLGDLLRPRLERWLADLDELVDGAGDGAVSVDSGRLAGVEPVLVPLDHVGLVRRRGLLGATDRSAEHPVFTLVATWVGSN